MGNSRAWLRGAGLVVALVAMPVVAGSVGAAAEDARLTAFTRSPMVLAQAAARRSNPPPADYLMNSCMETEPDQRSIDPAGAVRNYLESLHKKPLDITEFNPTLLQGPRRGTLDQISGNDATKNMPPQIHVSYVYTPEAGFLGKDRAVFTVEYQGKHFKVVMDIHALEVMDIHQSACPARDKVIKLRKPSRGDAGDTLAL